MNYAFFNYMVTINTVPMVNSFISSLAETGCTVDLFTVNDNSVFPYKNIRIYNFKKFILNNLSPAILFYKSFAKIRKNKYDYIVAIDPQTIIPVLLLKKLFGLKTIYISLEIYVKEDCSNLFLKIYFFIQKYFVKKFDIVMIMDQERLDLLQKNCKGKIADNSIVFLPNSLPGKASFKPSHFLHKKLGLDSGLKLILNPGEITQRSFASDLALYSDTADEQYRIVLHSRRKRINDELISSLRDHNSLIVSLDPVLATDLEELYSSAYIGLVLYRIADKGITAQNLYHIGKSSGKLNYFLFRGIPVVMCNLNYFKYISEKYNCGVCINDFSELSNAIKTISENYELFSKNAINCYNNELNFDDYFTKFSEYLKIKN